MSGTGAERPYEMEAARQRHSVRRYTGDPLSEEHAAALRAAIEEVNREGNLNATLVLNEPKAFGTIPLKVIGFSKAVNYIAMIGPEDGTLNERCGYYGERLVLLAQSLGLRTCWALMCDKKRIPERVGEGQRFVIGISVGYGQDDGKQHKGRPASEMGLADGVPEWFARGIECAMLAPSGVNRQPIRFELDGNKVSAVYKKGNMTRIDCGIAMYHFELGAGRENFVWNEPL